jgi:hypothetical protein
VDRELLFHQESEPQPGETTRLQFNWAPVPPPTQPRDAGGQSVQPVQPRQDIPVQVLPPTGNGGGLNGVPEWLRRPWRDGNFTPVPIRPAPERRLPDMPTEPGWTPGYQPQFPPNYPWPTDRYPSPWLQPGDQTMPSPHTRIAPDVAPTLYYGRRADMHDRTTYPRDDRGLQIYQQNVDSVAKIIVNDTVDGKPVQGAGTGFFINENGRMATAYHVVSGNGQITVEMNDGRRYNARVVDIKPMSDLAVLQVEGKPDDRFKPVQLADTSKNTDIGSDVYVVGHPRGWSPAFLSAGTLTGRHQLKDDKMLVHPHNNPNHMMLSSKLHVEKGSSGSPLFNSEGKVIGVVSFGDGGWSSNSEVVEDLHSLLGNSKTSDYFPSSLTVGPTVKWDGLLTAGSQIPNLISRFAPNSRVLGFAGAGFGYLGLSRGLSDMTIYDLPAFNAAWSQNGTTAEKFNSTMNLGADASMIVGGFGMMLSSRYRTAASLLVGAGGLWKVLNGIGTDRTY